MATHQQLQEFIENLMSLKDHNQSLLAEYEKKVTHSREQLSHIDALLVTHLGGNQQFVQSLIELRSHYQALLDEQQQKANQAKEQLSHLNALLLDQLVWQTQQSISLPTALEDQQRSLYGIAPEKESLQLSDADTPSDVEEQSEPEQAAFSIEDTNESRLVSAQKTPMLPKYQNLTKIQAVEKLLQENPGSILHVDYIIRSLYGELDATEIKAEKPRMYDTLSQGTEKGLWDKVPDQASCYTINLELVEPSATKQTEPEKKVASGRKERPRGRASDDMLPRYQHLNLTAAVEAVVYANAGEVLTTDRIAETLYGKLEGKALTKAKDKIGKTLWGGFKQKRWDKVPGKLGCYTLDLSRV